MILLYEYGKNGEARRPMFGGRPIKMDCPGIHHDIEVRAPQYNEDGVYLVLSVKHRIMGPHHQDDMWPIVTVQRVGDLSP